MFKRISFFSSALWLIGLTMVHAVQMVTIDIGSDRTVSAGSEVQIVAELGGMCANSAYATIYWMEKNNKGDWVTKQSGDTTNTSYSFVASTTKEVKVRYNCPLGTAPIFTNQIISEDTITITVTAQENTTTGGGRSWYNDMEDEAKLMFATEESIRNIAPIKLKSSYDASLQLVKLEWNTVGGLWSVGYELDYATRPDFSDRQTFETMLGYYYLPESVLRPNTSTHYFRVRARYLGKYAAYSTTYSYRHLDVLDFQVECVSCKKPVDVLDGVFDDSDVIIEDVLKIECHGDCKKKHFGEK